jgi:hypothetical protein
MHADSGGDDRLGMCARTGNNLSGGVNGGRSNMLKTLSVLAVVSLAATATSPAYADVITTFNLNGTFDDTSMLSGSLTIDTTNGAVSSADVIIGPPNNVTYTSFAASAQGSFYSLYFPNPPYLQLLLDTPSLVDYQGGNLLSLADNHVGFITGTFTSHLETGTAIPQANVPEPSSFALLGTSLLGFASICLGRLGRRKQGTISCAPNTADICPMDDSLATGTTA